MLTVEIKVRVSYRLRGVLFALTIQRMLDA